MDGVSEMVREGQIIGSQLRKARQILQISPFEIAEYLGIPEKEVRALEEERAKPSLQQLERLAELLGREVDYFLKETPSLPTEIQFRSLFRHSLSELPIEARRAIAKFDELCRFSLELEETLGKKHFSEVRRANKNILPIDLAKSERRNLGFDGKPARKLREVLEKIGIRIFELLVPKSDFSGFSYWNETYGPCILINSKDNFGRRNFTLAHEYAHLLYDDAPLVCEIGKEGRPVSIYGEQNVDRFAIEFLMPFEQVHDDFINRGLSSTPSVQEMGKLAGKWYVSVQAMFYRLEDLKLVEEGYADKTLASFKQPKPFRPPKVPTWKRRLGEDYVTNAIEAYRKGYITLGKLAHSLDLNLRKALEVAESN